jgi:hypothetical protein
MTNALTASLLREAELLCQVVAPRDLANLPIYIVPVSRLPPDLGGQSVCNGYTSPSLDLHLQAHISAWQGRGPCMVIHDLQLERAGGCVYESDFFGIVLHELAHILERPTPYRVRDSREPRQRAQIAREAAAVARAVSEVPRPSPPIGPYTRTSATTTQPAPLPWDQHEAPFVRAAFHLWHRARSLRMVRHPTQIHATESLHMSPATEYAAALANEAARMANASFRQILAARPPYQFTRLWTGDIARYLNRKEHV